MTRDIHKHRILILDFGSQYTQLIARRVRDFGVYSELHPFDYPEAEIRKFAPTGIILSGGPESVTDLTTARAPEVVFNLGCPVLGICYGMQTMAEQLGGKVKSGLKREFGKAKVTVSSPSKIFAGIEDDSSEGGDSRLDVWMSHGDHVDELPPKFISIASSGDSAITAMADEARNFYGLQFHPEVSHTPKGEKILERFIFDICGCEPVWTTENIIEESIDKIHAAVGDEDVILGLSGGVDSSVLAALLQKAIGRQLTCVFVDTGLLRLNEATEVQNLFAKHLGMNLITVEAEDRFLDALAGISDPEEKRKVIGKMFITIFEEEAKKVKNAKWLAQGTIYPDVIESAGTRNGSSHLIKSHHNVGGLPDIMNLKLLEPLRELFKDEVIKLGIQLGLPMELLRRHPFPGPGLGVRILGEVKKEYADKLRSADFILIEELYKNNLYQKVNQAFVVFLPIKSVGVLGDARHYDHVVCVRAVQTVDFMTAHWAHLPYEFLEVVSNRIINEVPGISRVTYDISSKPPATIEWE
jgi:GMP synthase (glutamine-hydrolysing)